MSVRISGVRRQSIWPSVVSDDAQRLRDCATARLRDCATARLRDWLLALGFTEDLMIPGERDGAIHHAQFDWPEGGRVLLSSTNERPTPCRPGTSSLHVVTADPDAAFERAQALSATIVRPLTDQTDYPSRDFTIADPDGNHWSLATFAG
jgi:uncharacterized glyoxalase superfamily protein PhnB